MGIYYFYYSVLLVEDDDDFGDFEIADTSNAIITGVDIINKNTDLLDNNDIADNNDKLNEVQLQVSSNLTPTIIIKDKNLDLNNSINLDFDNELDAEILDINKDNNKNDKNRDNLINNAHEHDDLSFDLLPIQTSTSSSISSTEIKPTESTFTPSNPINVDLDFSFSYETKPIIDKIAVSRERAISFDDFEDFTSVPNKSIDVIETDLKIVNAEINFFDNSSNSELIGDFVAPATVNNFFPDELATSLIETDINYSLSQTNVPDIANNRYKNVIDSEIVENLDPISADNYVDLTVIPTSISPESFETMSKIELSIEGFDNNQASSASSLIGLNDKGDDINNLSSSDFLSNFSNDNPVIILNTDINLSSNPVSIVATEEIHEAIPKAKSEVVVFTESFSINKEVITTNSIQITKDIYFNSSSKYPIEIESDFNSQFAASTVSLDSLAPISPIEISDKSSSLVETPSGDIKIEPELSQNIIGIADDVFGDFKDATAVDISESLKLVPKCLSNLESIETSLDSTTNSLLSNSDANIASTIDSFDNFGNFSTSISTTTAIESSLLVSNAVKTDENNFSISTTVIEANPLVSNAIETIDANTIQVEDDDDFGDFETSTISAVQITYAPTTISENVDDDDFDDFAFAPVVNNQSTSPKQPLTQPSTNVNSFEADFDNDDDFTFVSPTPIASLPSADQVNVSSSNDNADDDSFEFSAPASSSAGFHAFLATPNEEFENNFKNIYFDILKSASIFENINFLNENVNLMTPAFSLLDKIKQRPSIEKCLCGVGYMKDVKLCIICGYATKPAIFQYKGSSVEAKFCEAFSLPKIKEDDKTKVKPNHKKSTSEGLFEVAPRMSPITVAPRMSPTTVSKTISKTSVGIMEFEALPVTKATTNGNVEIKKPIATNNLNDIYGFDFYAPPNTSVATNANAILSQPAPIVVKHQNVDDDDDEDWGFQSAEPSLKANTGTNDLEDFIIPTSTQSSEKIESTTISNVDFDFFAPESISSKKVEKPIIEKSVAKVVLPPTILDIINQLPDLSYLYANKLTDAATNMINS